MATISFVNQKGGVSKTTTLANVASIFAKDGKKVLIVDTDPQGAVATFFGFKPDLLEKTIYEVFFENLPVEDALLNYEKIPNLFILPSNILLATGEVKLLSEIGRETFLKRTLEKVKTNFDYIFIDCPPSLSLLSTNALVASDYVIIPTAPDSLSMRGLENLIDFALKVKNILNHKLTILGIVIAMFDKRTVLEKEMINALNRAYGDMIKVFDTFIMNSVKVKESYVAAEPVILYDPHSKVAQQFVSLAKEIEERIKEVQNEEN